MCLAYLFCIELGDELGNLGIRPGTRASLGGLGGCLSGLLP